MPAPSSERLPATAALELLAPATVDAVDLVQDLVTRLHEDTVDDLSFTDRMRFETALVEIVANVVAHSRPVAGGEVQLHVTLRRDERELLAVVTDDGRPAGVDIARATMSDVESDSGRGLAMARALCSELRHERDAHRNRWIIRCHCDS